MMGYIWAGLMIIGVMTALFSGELEELNTVFFQSCEEAVFFTIGLAGIMALWSGIMNIAKGAGMIRAFSKAVKPILNYIFPEEKNEETLSLIIMNMVMNMFGAGNSATVFGIKAMKVLDRSNCHRQTASKTMCMFLVINMSSVQLIPLTIIKIRSDVGSLNPVDVLVPTIIATFVSTLTGIIICKFFERRT